MMSHGWPIVVKGGLLDPRGYPPLYALMIVSHRLLRYGTPLLHVLAALATLALLRPRPRLPARRRRAGRAARRRVRRRPRREPAARRPLLRADHRRARRRPLRLAAPRHAGRLGRAGGHAVSRLPALAPQARARPARRRRGALLVAAPVVARRGAARSAWSRTATRSTASAASAATGTRSRSTSCARWSPAPSTWAPGWRSTRATRGSRASARCCAARRSTSCRTWSTSLRGEMSLVGPRPTLQVQVDRYTERQRQPARRPARPDRLGAGQRPRVAALARAHRARPLVPRARVAAARPAHPRRSAPAWPITGHGLYRGETGGWRELPLRARPPGPCRCRPRGTSRSASKTLGFIVGQPSWWSQAVAATAYGMFVAVLEQQHVVAVRRSRRRASRAGRRSSAGVPGLYWSRSGRARACARACRAPACRPAS